MDKSKRSVPYEFTKNDWPSIGAEIELQLVDAETYELKNIVNNLLEKVPEEFKGNVKPEVMQSYVEINSNPCNLVSELESDLKEKLVAVSKAAEGLNTKLSWSATHPFSNWHVQEITPIERYYQLIEIMQDLAKRLVTFGLHIHIGVDSGDKSVMICDRILKYLPTLLALSTNSPFWCGRNTGLHSKRIKIMEALPTGGLPPIMRNWSEFVWLMDHLVETGFISTVREIWWDVRPHYRFGTVEVRICDLPANLDDVLGIAALIQCLIYKLSDEIDHGLFYRDTHPMLVQQNKWRACRYGLEANLVDLTTHKQVPARKAVKELAEKLKEVSQELKCEEYLKHAIAMADQPTGSENQLQIYKKSNDFTEVVKNSICL